MVAIEIRTQRREQLIDITGQVAGVLAASGVAEGIAHVWCPHTTAAITVNEAADPSVAEDIVAGLGRLVPRHAAWRHAEGNADAHLKASLVGVSVSVPVSDGRLVLGTWQGIFFCEFDGPRTRRIEVRVSRL